MANVYIVITLIVAFVLTVIFVALFSYEYVQQRNVINKLAFPQWKHVNKTIEYSAVADDQEEVQLSCPVDQHMIVTEAVYQFYDPLGTGEESWLAETSKGGNPNHFDSYWTSYGKVTYSDGAGVAGDYTDYVGQCNFKQSIASFLNQQCLNATGNCTVKVNKDGTVPWTEQTEELAICSSNAYCLNGGAPCKFSLNVSYVCTSEEEVQRMVAFSQDTA